MKTLGRLIVALVIVVVIALVVLRITGLDPKDRRPGLWLSGTVASAPVADWSFTNSVPVIQLQTRTWYGVPHSVNIWCVAYNNQLFLHSTFPPNVPFPNGKAWTSAITRDPRVRLKIGNQLYDGVAMVVTDPGEVAMLNELANKKYPRPAPNSTVYFFRILPPASETAKSS
jgi:hypothetical protein